MENATDCCGNGNISWIPQSVRASPVLLYIKQSYSIAVLHSVLKVFITQNDIFQTHRFKTGNFCYFSNSSDKKEYRLVGLTSCWKLKHTFYHIPGAIFSHMSIYLGQLVRFFCHGGTKLSFSRLSGGEPFLYCNNMFGLLLFKAY